jgi:hypothetical protein
MEPLGSAQRRSLGALLNYPLGDRGRAYLEARGLAGVAGSLGLGEVASNPTKPEHRRYAGRLVIPSFSARGTVCDMALRCMKDHDCGAEGCPKYLFLPGVAKRLFGLEDLAAPGSVIHIAEGHPDRMTLKACGLNAVGVAGVNAWKPYHRRLFAGYEQVYFWAQSDDKGQSEGLGERIRSGLRGVSVIMVPNASDLNTYYQQVGKEGVLALLDGSEEPEGEAEDERDDEGPRDEWDAPPF